MEFRYRFGGVFFSAIQKKEKGYQFFCVSRQTEALEMLSKCQRKSFFVIVLILTLLKKFFDEKNLLLN